ncbi:MAG: ribosomal protein S18-alanine N-acetyltransferase [Oscillospiraceae bacterium]|jgi:ribosomal-protein-alanine acetyltransferase|nr:ribosomal protein S18-alanine N-acetyltransferase [Oscillospiraceae bacterium]
MHLARQILFLCAGNTCRSPMAAALFAALCAARGDFHAVSAGLAATPGQPAAAHMQIVAAEKGLNISAHESRQADVEALRAADCVVCLSADIVRAAARFAAPERLYLLGGGISDPYGGDQDAYRACAAQMEAALPSLLRALQADCVIRAMTEADLPAVLALEQVGFGQEAWSAALFRSAIALPGARYYVAARAGEILGFAGTQTAADATSLDTVAIHPAYQRQGLAHALLARAEADAVTQGGRALWLEVREGNTAARRLYEVRGYKEVNRRRAYYAHPTEDAILMTLEVR